MANLSEVIDEFSGAFVRDRRDDGSEFYKRADNAPDWIDSDLMHRIHSALDDRLPDDWVYATAYRSALHLADYCEDDTTPDDLADYCHEIADGLVDVYNADLTAWLAETHYNAALCDEAESEFGSDPDGEILPRIARGQFLAIDRIVREVLAICAERVEELESEGGE